MKSLHIKLNMAENVKRFVNIVSSFDCEMDLRSGRYVVDAKSILGIFSLDLNRPVILEIYSDDCNDVIEKLKDYIID